MATVRHPNFFLVPSRKRSRVSCQLDCTFIHHSRSSTCLKSLLLVSIAIRYSFIIVKPRTMEEFALVPRELIVWLFSRFFYVLRWSIPRQRVPPICPVRRSKSFPNESETTDHAAELEDFLSSRSGIPTMCRSVLPLWFPSNYYFINSIFRQKYSIFLLRSSIFSFPWKLNCERYSIFKNSFAIK